MVTMVIPWTPCKEQGNLPLFCMVYLFQGAGLRVNLPCLLDPLRLRRQFKKDAASASCSISLKP